MRRALAGFVACLLSVSLLSQTANAKTLSGKLNEVGTPTAGNMLNVWSSSDIEGNIITPMNNMFLAAEAEMGKSSEAIDYGVLLTNIAEYFITLDWICQNVWVNKTDSGEVGVYQKTVLGDFSGSAGTKYIVDRDVAKQLFTQADTLLTYLESEQMNVLPEESKGRLFVSISGISAAFARPGGEELLSTSSDLVGCFDFMNPARAIMNYYCNANMVAVLMDTLGLDYSGMHGSNYATKSWEIVEELNAVDAIKSANTATPGTDTTTPATDPTTDAGSTPPTATGLAGVPEFRTLLQRAEVKERIAPFWDAYSEISHYYETMQGFGLKDEAINGTQYYGLCLGMTDLNLYYSEVVKGMDAVWNPTTTDVPFEESPVINVDLTKLDDPLSLMSTASIVNKQIIKNGELELRDVGYYILAAGCCYDPFVSIAGNESWLSTVESFFDDDEVKESIKKILKLALNTKKPLYVAEVNKNSFKTEDKLSSLTMADYRFANLKDALDIGGNKTYVYCVVRGQMTPSQVDGSSWEYANQGTIDGTAPGTSTEVTIENPGEGTVAENTTGIPNDLVTVGTSSLSATDDQVTLPVMITMGNTASLFSDSGGTGLTTAGYTASVGGLTSVILHNAMIDAKSNTKITNAATQQLFMNGLGDIVLADNTIVMPAVANPVLYNYGDGYNGKSDDDFVDIFCNEASKDGGDFSAYYPYTAAFMNHYPTGRLDKDKNLVIDNSNDQDKYMIIVYQNHLYAKQIAKVGEKSYIAQDGAIPIAHIYGSAFNVTSVETDVRSVLSLAQGKAGRNFGNYMSSMMDWFLIFPVVNRDEDDGSSGKGDSIYDRDHTIFMLRSSVSLRSGPPFFPLTNSNPDIDDDFISRSGPLTTSARRFVADPLDTNAIVEETRRFKASGSFNVSHFVEDFLAEGLLGTQYTETLVKNYQVSYDDIVEDTGGRLLKFFTQLTDSAIETLGKIDGVLAIKGPYENTFFNAVLTFIQDFYLLIAVAILIVVAVKFMQGRYNVIYVFFISLLCIAGFELYAHWLPNIIPSVYNFVVNDTIEDVVWSTVCYKAEQYDESYGDSNRVDATTGRSKPYTSTITLYTLSNAEMQSVASRLGVSYEEVRRGQQLFIDQTAGIFVQGNAIKMSVDKLLVNNTMRGLYQTQWDQMDGNLTAHMTFQDPALYLENTIENPYSIQLTGPYVSLESYYTPYDHFERAFLYNLNKFTAIFSVERNAFSYVDGDLYKDAFVVNAFVHSGIFTAPGDDDILYNNIDLDNIQGAGGAFANSDDVISAVHSAFDPQEDWLSLANVFFQPDDGFRNSLWGYIMQMRGWYDLDWVVTTKGEEKLTDLILYINNLTKQWVIENESQINYMSDENAIKMISLYATTCYTHYVSEITEWLYPNYINASELELEDVLYGSMTTLKDRNFAYDGTVTNTVAVNLGTFGILFLLLITLFAAIFVFCITYIIPILYGMFGAVLVYKLINDDAGIGVVQGYTKVTLTTAVLYIIFSLSLRLVRLGGYRWYGYLGTALLMLLCLYFLFWTCISVVQDFGELGNRALAGNLLKGLDNITAGAVKKMSAALGRTALQANNFLRTDARRYSHHASVDNYEYSGSSRSLNTGLFGGASSRQESSVDGHRRGVNPYGGYDRGSYYDESYNDGRNVSRTGRNRRPAFDWLRRPSHRAGDTQQYQHSHTDNRDSVN